MTYRYDIINFLLRTYFTIDAHYLEIGVANPEHCFDKIQCSHKISVDPNNYLPSDRIDYKLTSDEFFTKLDNSEFKLQSSHKWDIIFIDGLHLADQVYKDIFNALNHCNPNGFIILHDCNPPHCYNAHSDLDFFLANPTEWNGSTWKAFYKFRTTMPLKSYTVDTDYGIGIIELNKTQPLISHSNPWFEFGHFTKNRQEQIGLISIFDFYKTHSKIL